MDFGTFLWTTLSAFLTLATFSFLYRDNPFYKIAEHLVVGVSAGYFVVILWHNGLVPNLFQRLADGDWYFLWLNSSKPWYLIPAILGALMWTRFSRNYAWVSRWPLALYIGIATGVAIPLEMANRVNRQLYATMANINWSNFWGAEFLDPTAGFSQLIIFAGAIAALFYFFFSTPHTGVFGGIARFGIWILMIGFGATFGLTVMGRISLFINRIQDLDDWRAVAFDASNPNYSGWFQAVFWLIILGIVACIVVELVKFARRRA
jgi:NADH:ubiquinone oxidoreductase subunit 6 (subunit J)